VTLNFFFVEAHTTYGLLIVVASLHFFVYRKTRSAGSRLFLIAVGFAAVSAIIYLNRWSFSPWFNYNDISHVLLTFAAWYFYSGSKKIGKELTTSGKIILNDASSADSLNTKSFKEIEIPK
jgi:hypothetical protein